MTIEPTPPSNSSHRKSHKAKLTRRKAIRFIAGGTFSTILATTFTQRSAAVPTKTASTSKGALGTQPLSGVRIIERSQTLAGRLIGLLFADQGAEVFVERRSKAGKTGLDDEYFDRGKIVLPASALDDTSSADAIIVDGEVPVRQKPYQILLRVTAALPGDEEYGYLPADCSEDLLNALVGFFTDMSVSGRAIGRPVIYTPLPLCSVYAGVNGAVAMAAALVDRERTGLGREIIVSRLAGGLSAIGALSLTSSGLPAHLKPTDIGGVPEGLSLEEFKKLAAEAKANPARQLWLEQRFAPLAAPYRTADGRFFLIMAGPNRRLTRRALEALNLWDKALAAGMVDVSSYDPANIGNARRNLADSLALNFALTSKLADMLEETFAKRTAAEWEKFLNDRDVAGTVIYTWEEWQKDRGAIQAKIIAPVSGLNEMQIGRASWVKSAQPYPDLKASRQADRLPPRTTPIPSVTGVAPSLQPLAGFTMADFTNVVAGPNCSRMFVELGATVTKVDPTEPYHSPTIVVTWSGESAVGKRSIIINPQSNEGKEVIRRLVSKSDFVLANMLDDQIDRLGASPTALAKLNPTAIAIQITAYRGESRGPRHDNRGYDPALQGTTGVMTRFGPEGCPTYHGVASCVDYLCGYLGTWAGVIALFARERRRDGRGDWAETSLCTAATLTQLLLQKTAEPISARGPNATGMNAGERVYQLSDGWIFAQGASDLSKELAGRNRADALKYLATRKINAVPIQTCREIANRHRDKPTKTVRFEQRLNNGWETECFAPTWFTFDGKPTPRPRGASRLGADAPTILAELGFKPNEVERLIASGAIGRTEWAKS